MKGFVTSSKTNKSQLNSIIEESRKKVTTSVNQMTGLGSQLSLKELEL